MRPRIIYAVKSRPSGFTLIELLVVVAIIAILASLLLPTLSHANFAAKNTVCKRNLRQIVLAIQMYANTHEAFPLLAEVPAGQWKAQEDFAKALGLPTTFITGSDVGLISHKYRRLGGVFLCPLNEGPRMTMHFGGSGPHAGTTEEFLVRSAPTYGYGAWGIRAGPSEMPMPPLGLSGNVVSFTDIPPVQRATKESTVQVPSEMIAMGDAFNRSPNPALDGLMHWDGSIEPVTAYYSSVENYNSTSKTPPKKQPNFIAHRRRANRAFVDGHIESEDMRKPFAASDAELRRWNIDNEAHREYLRN